MTVHSRHREPVREGPSWLYVLWFCLSLIVACSSHSLMSFSITPQTVTLNLGESVQFTAAGVFNSAPSPAPLHDVTWTSSNPQVLAINSAGVATCHSEGVITVTASAPTSPGPPMTLTTTVTCESQN